ncbi:hypothetical protein [Streptomyces sp. NPDC012888]|uniref:hypothetical protein n=1 Tax=Streptomyces sp. NPDC012888 TaxID=3364855 RepID=UPI0036C00D73
MKRSMTMSTAAVLTGLTLFVTACTGGSGSSGSEDSAAPGSGGNAGTDAGKIADDALRMRKCLRGQGIDAPDPQPGQDPRAMTVGGGSDPAKLQKAMEACGMKGPGAGGEPGQQEKDQQLKWVQCMRKNGVNLPDPQWDGGMRKATEIPKGQEKAFEEAQKKCETA